MVELSPRTRTSPRLPRPPTLEGQGRLHVYAGRWTFFGHWMSIDGVSWENARSGRR